MTIDKCEECGGAVVRCDNNTLLDYPSVPYDEYRAMWTIMRMGSMALASVGNPGVDGKGHTLHEHQPEGSVMAG